MSQQKRWPKVANQARIDSIFTAGEIKNELKAVLSLGEKIEKAIRGSNFPLALAMVSDLETRIRLTQLLAETIQLKLENVPTGNDLDDGENGD